ncbi:unnamed protein product [Cuscuta campestris]|uniref:Hydroxyproline-rich glycoprotein family protein n=1 Tax=Cuscuta campestris TaxID=132261 RepID=A0A484LG99_9ASTE|nr:unnamed protein product [Cuscuta campestris]
MESSYSAPPHAADASRPSLGFPLGTALLLIVVFTLSGVFSCCYHWDKLRSLRRRSFPDDGPHKPTPDSQPDLKVNRSQTLPVVMPGDEVPKFLALPCPRQPPLPEKIVVEVQKPPPPYKPPLRGVESVPFY